MLLPIEETRISTLETDQASMSTSLTGKEVTANKATNFSTVNDTLYPTATPTGIPMLVRIAGSFVTVTAMKVKVAGTFTDATKKIKIGGVFA